MCCSRIRFQQWQRRVYHIGKRRVRLYCGHLCRSAGCFPPGDLDRRGWLYDRRSEGDQQGIRDQIAELFRSDGVISFRGQGDLSSDYPSGLSKGHSAVDQEYDEPYGSRFTDHRKPAEREGISHQRNFVHFRYQPGNDSGIRYGWSNRSFHASFYCFG